MNETREEVQRLQKLRLEETIRPFEVESDAPRVIASAAQGGPEGMDNITAKLDELGLQREVRPIVEGFNLSMALNRGRNTTVNLAEAPSPYANSTLNHYGVDMSKDTVEGMIGMNHDPNAQQQRKFAATKFPDEVTKREVLAALVDYCFKLSLVPFNAQTATQLFPNVNDEAQLRTSYAELRQRQQTACLGYMGRMNPYKASIRWIE